MLMSLMTVQFFFQLGSNINRPGGETHRPGGEKRSPGCKNAPVEQKRPGGAKQAPVTTIGQYHDHQQNLNRISVEKCACPREQLETALGKLGNPLWAWYSTVPVQISKLISCNHAGSSAISHTACLTNLPTHVLNNFYSDYPPEDEWIALISRDKNNESDCGTISSRLFSP